LTNGFESSAPGSAASPEEARASKRRLRSLCQQMRDELGAPYQRQASDLICIQIEAWEPFRNAAVVFSFLPMRGEVDLRRLFSQFPLKRWGIPRVVEEPPRHLEFHSYRDDYLVRHRYGMLEPDPTLAKIPSTEADLVIVPGMAFTRAGYRLGYGGGYYDRLLSAGSGAMTLGVCYQALLLDVLPHGDRDLPVEHVVTERLGVVDCG
jgi:5-formyltetrahydrofolate cyclo-ligase